MIRDNNLLGEFRFADIPPAPALVPKLAVTFEIDSDVILHATALDKGTGRKSEITVVNERGRLSKADIDRIIMEAEMYVRYREEDEAMKKKVDARNDLETHTYKVKKAIGTEDVVANLSLVEKLHLEEVVKAAVEWLEYHPEAELAELGSQKEKLDNVWSPLVKRFYG